MKDVKIKNNDDLKAKRESYVKEVVQLMELTPTKRYESYLASDLKWEDPFSSYNKYKHVVNHVNFCKRILGFLNFSPKVQIKRQFHGAKMFIIEYAYKITDSSHMFGALEFNLRQTTHLNSFDKISYVREEIGSGLLLDDSTSIHPIIGRLFSQYRMFNGRVVGFISNLLGM